MSLTKLLMTPPPKKKVHPKKCRDEVRREAEMFLLTVAMKATVVGKRRCAALTVLRHIARGAVRRQSTAAQSIQRTWRRRPEPPIPQRDTIAKVQACIRRILTQTRAAVACACLERQLAADALRLWRDSATPLSTRAKVWRDCFEDIGSFFDLSRARRVVQQLATSDIDTFAADAAERKALYVALRANRPGLDLAVIYRTFGLGPRRRRRSLVGALFSTTDLAPASADVVRRLFCSCPTVLLELEDLSDGDAYDPVAFAKDVRAWHRSRSAGDVDLSCHTLAGRIRIGCCSEERRLFPATGW